MKVLIDTRLEFHQARGREGGRDGGFGGTEKVMGRKELVREGENLRVGGGKEGKRKTGVGEGGGLGGLGRGLISPPPE